MNKIKLKNCIDFETEFDTAIIMNADESICTLFVCSELVNNEYEVALYDCVCLDSTLLYDSSQKPIWSTKFFALTNRIKRYTLSCMLDILAFDYLYKPYILYENFGGTLNGLVKANRQIGVC